MMRPSADAGASTVSRHEYIRTCCGRELTIGRLALGDARHPAARVFVDLGSCPDSDAGWASLTVAEAGQLAQVLLSQAAVAEQECAQRSVTTERARRPGR